MELKRLGDGSRMTQIDRIANAEVDELAKSAARADRLPKTQLESVKAWWDRVTAIALWIGQATALAAHFPEPAPPAGDRRSHVRDSEGRRAIGIGHAKRARERKGPLAKPSSLPADSAPFATAVSVVRRVRRKLANKRASLSANAVARQRRSKTMMREAERARHRSEGQVARWLSDMTLAPNAQPSASARLAALRERVRAKEAARLSCGIPC